MISPSKIHDLATREQTTDINIAREYLQHLFLSNFYKLKGSENFLFKGGTAIRIVFNGSRYSEDLDFSASTIGSKLIENLLVDTFTRLEQEGVVSQVDIEDANTTTGGYIENINIDILGFKTGIKANIQIKNNKADLIPETVLIDNSPFVPAYSLIILSTKLLVKEKIQALISRAKPRDFFDLYFFIRSEQLKDYIPRDRTTLEAIKDKLEKVDDKMLEADLRDFLPINYRPIIKNIKTQIIRSLNL